MSQEGEQQRNTASVTEEGDGQGRGAKRGRNEEELNAVERGGSGDAPSPKRVAKSHEVLFRIVVPSRQIGKVIGKQGCRIQKIREETKAMIKIADAIAPYEERVIIISSKDDDSKVSDAEHALHHIAKVILQDDGNAEPANISAGHMATSMIRLLIAGSQAGCLIGMSGQNIANLRNSSGASIMILAQNQFPLCASAHESDRLVQISGDVPEVLKAVEQIGYQLRENPPKKIISVRPQYNLNHLNQSYLAPVPADYVTLEIMIPESMVGGLIGKCGANISKIRYESGATIKVSGERGEQAQRQIHFGGSAQQVAWAKKLVDDYIFSQAIRQSGS
ncbi:PREDICTED: poly(rC)-binding protein 4-like [Nelumbo nucifera]|uniref:Poly(RC)-binding protein 4-like n=1 Tax=Nelumbo nucifera TaxID=4432 RepID=A0A1U8BFV0_NELNU|nr:PREDICTED: poly(rC)-binding protein 4-like [Nelumbo nucifera]